MKKLLRCEKIMLLTRDMEMILRKFVYEQLFSRKFRGKELIKGETILVSQNNEVNEKNNRYS